MLAFTCPRCRLALEFGNDAAGSIVRCPKCRTGLRLPSAAKLAARQDDDESEEEELESVDDPQWVGLLLPACVLVLGFAAAIGGLALHAVDGRDGVATWGATFGVTLLGLVMLGAVGMAIGGPTFGIDFGTLGSVALRLFAAALLTAGMIGVTGISPHQRTARALIPDDGGHKATFDASAKASALALRVVALMHFLAFNLGVGWLTFAGLFRLGWAAALWPVSFVAILYLALVSCGVGGLWVGLGVVVVLMFILARVIVNSL